jgi:regulator of replication initiation timing
MALRKQDLEEINEQLQAEIRRLHALDAVKLEQENLALREENERLADSLSKANERLRQVEQHYNKLRDYVSATVSA